MNPKRENLVHFGEIRLFDAVAQKVVNVIDNE
jgi:hypothetical protein